MKTRRRSYLNKTKRGGKVIAEGATAFVIDPPIQCKDGKDMKDYVTRVSKELNFGEIMSKDNKKIINKLKKIDPEQKYFFYPQYCTPGKLTEENKKDGVTEENKKYSEFMNKGESDWNKYYARYRPRTWKEFFKGRKKYIKESQEIPLQEQVDHLIEGVKILHKNKIFHTDLHPGNFLIGPDGLPRIIDFARSVYDPPKVYYKYEMEGFMSTLKGEIIKDSFNS